MARHRPRPRRGQPGPDVLDIGDVGEYHPQGGARPLREAFRESGDLASREFGVPEADLPGGKGHVINPETEAADPAMPPERPADYHKYHGVSSDDGLYVVPDSEVGDSERPAPIPRLQDAVPVVIVAATGKSKVIRALVTEGPQTIASGTIDPVRIADRDPERIKLWVCNETTPSAAGATSPGIRIGDWETTADNRGLLIPAGQIKDFTSQAEVFATNQSGSPVTISWGYETEIQASGA